MSCLSFGWGFGTFIWISVWKLNDVTDFYLPGIIGGFSILLVVL